MYPLKTVVGQGKGGETGGADPQGIDGGADVVDKAGPGQFRRTYASADLVSPLQESDGETSSCQFDGRGQTVRPGAHDEGVRRRKCFHKGVGF
jgi:hypothetical protein